MLITMVISLLISVLLELQATDNLGILVKSDLPKELEKCIINTQTFAVYTKTGCVGLCQRTPTCLLACKNGKECRLYSANVSPHYLGTSQILPELVNYKCHSLWADPKDVAWRANISSITPDQAKYNKSNAVEGFSCQHYNDYHFHSIRGVSGGWFQADLGISRSVEKVIVQTRGSGTTFDTSFNPIEVRVGNYSGESTGIFITNPLLGVRNEVTPQGTIVTFVGSSPIQGQYVSIQNLGQEALIIFEMKIIII